jgi:3-deoxy-7-phosphoheptulonate synthase
MMQAPPASAFPDPRNNPVLRVLEARQRISDQAEDELRDVGRRSFAGRTYVDEKALGIKQGRLSVLGKGTVGAVQMEGTPEHA